MIAIAKPPVRAENTHDQFLSMLPLITELARRAFRQFDPERRDDLMHEVVANAYVAFSRLVEHGKQEIAYATPLADYALRQVISGRRVGSKLNTRDVLSPANHRVTVEPLQHYDRRDCEWKELLVEDHHAGPAETAAARIDLAGWLQSLPGRNRRIAKALSFGESTKDVASKFRVSAARVSQLRRELEASWLGYQGEAV